MKDGHVTAPKFRTRSSRIRRERGYMLLTLLLGISLLVIAAAAVAPTIALQIRRDREDELIHRGMEYRRAIRSFAKHTGRYPLRIEELQNTNETRYLRKLYKDPITGGEFRFLHTNDIAAYGARPNTASTPPDEGAITSSAAGSAAPTAGADSSAGPSPQPSEGPTTQTPPPAIPPPGNTGLGGGVIFGVASRSQKKTIREFNHKNRYNQWLFFYSAIYDGSFEVKGPTPLSPSFPAQKSSPDSADQPTPAATQQ
jgi:type II secretory pathway pseudopilin PulG